MSLLKGFAADVHHYRKMQPIKVQSCGAQFPWIHLQCAVLLHLRFKGNSGRGVRKIERVIGPGSETVPPSDVRGYTHRASPNDCPNMNKSRPAKWRRAQETSVLHKELGDAEGKVFP